MAGEERVTKLKIDNVKKIYQTRKGEMTALNGVNLDIKENEFICVVGPSGCGKSTLLNIIAGLDTPTSGTMHTAGIQRLSLYLFPRSFCRQCIQLHWLEYPVLR